MKKLSLDDIILFFYQREIPLNKRALVTLIESFDLGDNDLTRLDPSTKEYIVQYLFEDKESRNFYRSHGKEWYFLEILKKRLL
jgi:hypothetical protein